MMMLISTMAAMSMYETKKMTGTGATIPSSVNMTRVTEDAHASPVHTCTLGVLEHTHTYTHTLSHTHTHTHSLTFTHTHTNTHIGANVGRAHLEHSENRAGKGAEQDGLGLAKQTHRHRGVYGGHES